MKLLVHIFAIYVLALNMFPCTDVASDVVSHNSQTELISVSGLDHNHTASDLCPPFCTCHCCHVHIVDFGAVNFRPVSAQIASTGFLHFDDIGEESLHSLLDPPRI
ncbi:DUF6660 family protein [Zunongwangia sp. H14]|uniref:DUF6660 family protein n=1 Tax=Zunongwangia sp. H14 TaxID=3240792 RepID=UPI00356A4996